MCGEGVLNSSSKHKERFDTSLITCWRWHVAPNPVPKLLLGRAEGSRACEQERPMNGSHSNCGLAQLLASLQCPLLQGVTCSGCRDCNAGCRDCNTACSPSAATGNSTINTGSGSLVQGHEACVVRGMLCVTAAQIFKGKVLRTNVLG